MANALVEAMSTIRAVADALARQPGFDRAAFAAHLREEIALMEATRPAKPIVKHTLEEIARSAEAKE